jgi:glycosyltransferase involved in cell wall biosynthesis
MKKLRIGIAALGLETANDLRSAGIARYGAGLVDALAEGLASEHEFHIYVMPGLELPENWTSRPNLFFHRMWRRYTRWNVLIGGLEVVRRRLDYWISTAHTVPAWSRCPRVLMVHDLFALEHPEWLQEGHADFYRRTLPSSIKKADLLLANSDATRAQLRELLDVADSKIVVTPLGPGNRLDSVGEAPDSGCHHGRFIFTLSTLEPRKNLVRLIEAFARVKSKPNREDLRLLIGGGKGWGSDAVAGAIEQFGVANSVTLLGYVPDSDLPALFRDCVFYICPSLQEGFGMPVLEAMLAGAPVLCGATGALTEVGGAAARYFDPQDVNSMAWAMDEALSRPEERAQWAGRGRAQAGQFSWERTARLTIQALEERAA